MGFYKEKMFPKLLNFTMKRESMEEHRPGVCREAEGVTLEIGFGSGLNIPYYEHVSKLYALEPSAESFELALELIDEASFPVEHLAASAENIPLPDQSVDTVISTWTLCTIPDPARALKEVARVLKLGGRFIFIEHGLSRNRFAAAIQRIATPFSKKVAGGCHLDRDIETLIKESDLHVDNIEKFSAKLRPLIFMYRGIASK